MFNMPNVQILYIWHIKTLLYIILFKPVYFNMFVPKSILNCNL